MNPTPYQPHCRNGHPQTPENVGIRLDGGTRFCRLCKNASDQRYRKAQREGKLKRVNRARHHDSNGMLPCSAACLACERERREIASRVMKDIARLMVRNERRPRMPE